VYTGGQGESDDERNECDVSDAEHYKYDVNDFDEHNDFDVPDIFLLSRSYSYALLYIRKCLYLSAFVSKCVCI
jgi:hypothetical protein